ncbi:hypothetical protein PF003_g17778 [Phytophthora fragariae]|nr:hypothetical protein PF003_g17778 [Phytophthora fragariae]
MHDGFGGANGPVLFCLLLLQRCPAHVTEDGGGVRAADCILQLPSSKVRGRLVACMALVASLTMDLYCLCMLQRRRGWWRRPRSSMASCGWPAARFVVVWWCAWRWWRR